MKWLKNKFLSCLLAGAAVFMLNGCSLAQYERIEISEEQTSSADVSLENAPSKDAPLKDVPLKEKPSKEISPKDILETQIESSVLEIDMRKESSIYSDSQALPENHDSQALPENHDSQVLPEEEVQAYLQSMSLEEKVAQLFIICPESLFDGIDGVTTAGQMTREAINEIPVCGFIYMGSNLKSEEQVKAMLDHVQNYSMERIGLPAFLCVDEEGGTVARIGGSGKFDVPEITDMAVIGQKKDTIQAFEAGAEIGRYLSHLGFNVDFAPVADVLSNPDNNVVKKRSFGSDPKVVTDMASSVSRGLQSEGVLSTYKHFPGHGATAGDTHEGYAYTEKTLDELKACELVPFQNGIDENVPFVMVGHISLPNVLGENTPSSLSSYIIQDLLRDELGYEGIVITDALNMGAITRQYTSDEAAVKALAAGADIILMPDDFKKAYAGVLEAVKNGTLSEKRIDMSVMRILRRKLQIKKDRESW